MQLIQQHILDIYKNLARMLRYLTRLSIPMAFLVASLPGPALFNTELPPAPVNPTRLAERTVTKMTLHWQLVKWSDESLVCDLYLKHEQWPNFNDVYTSCGYEVWESWNTTPVCSSAAAGLGSIDCTGLFLRYLDQFPKDYVEQVELPGIVLKINPLNCAPGEWCNTRPLLEISASEPLEGYQIRNIHMRIGIQEFVIYSDTGRVTLPLTNDQGNWLDYWADSTFGDRSLPIRIKYRNFQSPDDTSFHFDLLDAEWSDSLPGGSLTWGVFPPLDDSLPLSLVQPGEVADLKTKEPYHYLTGYLIQSGKADASNCSDGGLYSGGSASPCGQTTASDQTIAWQNKYDGQIFDAAVKYNVPARLLKGIIAQESQFLPETNQPYEKGLGYITANGADMLLTWNIPYYLDICQPIYGEGICSYGFGSLKDVRRVLLRRMVMDKVGTPEEIDVLAAMLLASANQSGQIVRNLTGQDISYVTSYVDMWKLSTGNYFAGAGCMGDAIEEVMALEEPLTWDAIVKQLPAQCSNADMYVRQILDSTGTLH